MDTAIKNDEEKKEFFDEPEILDQKIEKLAKMILESRHFIVFTGAGISTSTGIADFRSGVNTVLETGPGLWEKKATGYDKKPKKSVPFLKAIPSKSHMLLVQLQRVGLLKYLVSQNVDGLHLRSGFPSDCLSELHGNTNLEKCKTCNKSFLRDFRTRTANKVHDHETTRKCENCGGKLYDSIINFGENLPEKDLNDSFSNAKKADLCIVFGSSLRVTPAANIPEMVGEKGDLVIVNLQKTPLDRVASMNIHAMCDTVSELLAKKLNMAIPDFELIRRFTLERTKENNLKVKGINDDGSPYSLFQEVKAISKNAQIVAQKEPFILRKCPETFKLSLQFFGHYNEKPFEMNIDLKNFEAEKVVTKQINYNFARGTWTV